MRRPIESLLTWQARYGDVFTVRYAGFGTGVYVADPDAIRSLFSGDQRDLRAGEANSFLEPVLGQHSVLVLDGPAHLRQRKLLLPPFQGSHVAGFRKVIREVAEREVAGWRTGMRLVLRKPGVLARLCERLDDDAYLDATVKEALRLRPVIDGAERTLTVPREVGGRMLPAGVKVYPAILLVQRREDLYPRAHEFRPERFLEGAPSYSWIPFGGGTRRCIGAALAQAEMAEVLRVVLARVALLPERAEPDPVVLRGITLVPRHGVRVRVAGRADLGA